MFYLKLFKLYILDKVWFKAVIFSLLAIVIAFLSYFDRYDLPDSAVVKAASQTVDALLSILASSMLSVTIFSINAMVSAYAAASSNGTPRANQLLMSDPITQNVVSTFIGSFIYSLFGIVALRMGIYGSWGRVILFFVTLGVIGLILVTLIIWVDHVLTLGKSGEGTKLVEKNALEGLSERAKSPSMGANTLHFASEVPAGSISLKAVEFGYLQHINIEKLSDIADEHDVDLFLVALPGKFVNPNTTLVWLSHALEEKMIEEIREAFIIGDERMFGDDPRLAISMLVEIATRALSPASTDTATAMDVIGRLGHLLSVYANRHQEEIIYKRLWVLELSVRELFDDVFTPLSREGANLIEIQLKLQNILLCLAKLEDKEYAESAYYYSQLALQRARKSMMLEDDIRQVEAIADQIQSPDRLAQQPIG